MNRFLLTIGILLAALSASAQSLVVRLPFDGAIDSDPAGVMSGRVFGEPGYVEGVAGQAIVVGGKARVTYPVGSCFRPAGGTVAAWVSPVDWTPKVPRFQFLFGILNNDQAEHRDLLVDKPHSETTLRFLMRGGGKVGQVFRPILSWRAGSWHHVAVSWGESAMRLYVDGRPAGQADAPPLPADGWGTLVVGPVYPSWAYVGEDRTAVDELALYDRALSAGEIAGLVRRQRAASPLLKRLEERAMPDGPPAVNLAADRACAVLTSSFANYREAYSDNLIDGDPDTPWRSFDGELPQWLELRWSTPVRLRGVTLLEAPPSRLTGGRVEVWEPRGRWREVARFQAADPATGRVTARFDEVAADRLRVVVTGNDGPVLHLAEVQAHGPEQVDLDALRPYWKGWHIWHDEPDRVAKMPPRYFRRSFELAPGEQLNGAAVQLYTNDLYEIRVNGAKVAAGQRSTGPVNLADKLRPGENVLAVICTPTSQPGWPNLALTAEATIDTDRGPRYLTTDDTWRSSDRAEDGWDQPGFDASRWRPPYLVARVGQGVWGRIGYTDAAGRVDVQLTAAELPAAAVRPGDSVTVRLKLRPRRALADDYAITWELGQEPVLGGNGDYTVCRGEVPLPAAAASWPTDADTEVAWKLVLPAWTPHGPVPLRLEGLNRRQGRGLRFVGPAGRPLSDVGSLTVDRYGAAPAGGERARMVPRDDGAPLLEIGGRPTVPLIWAYHNPTYEKLHLSAATGLHLYQARGYPLRPEPAAPERLCRLLDQHIQAILNIDPAARVIAFLDLRPSTAWLKEHPEAALIAADGRPGPQSYFAREHLDLVTAHLRQVLRHVEAQPYAGRVIGWHLITCGTPDSALGGVEGNQFEPDRAKISLGDHNPQALAAFRDWLTDRYHGDQAALRAAWRDDRVTFATAAVTNEQLTAEGAGGGVFRDPSSGAAPFDYFAFLSGGIARFYQKLAAVVKSETGKLVGCYYGYDTVHLYGYNSPGGVLQNNNFDETAMYGTDRFDYLAMVPSYQHRLAGSGFEPQHAVAGQDLHGKQYLAELDTRTVTAEVTQWGRQRSVRESVEVAKRDLATLLMDGHAGWFADWSTSGLRAVGYYIDPDLLSAIRRAGEIYAEELTQPRRSAARVAVVVSGKAWYYHDLYRAPPLYYNLVRRLLFDRLPHLGAPVDTIRLKDLADPRVAERYRVLVMLNPFALDSADRRAIDALKGDGRTIVWFYAPGYVDPEHGLSVDGVSRATGLKVALRPGRERPRYRPVAGHPLTAGAPEEVACEPYGYAASNALHPPEIAPLFAIDDSAAEALGRYADGQVAVAVRDLGTWRSVYSAVPFMDATTLRHLVETAGVHCYTAPGPVVRATGRLVMVHVGFGGEPTLTVNLPGRFKVTERLTGQVLATDADRVELPTPTCRTFLLELSPPER